MARKIQLGALILGMLLVGVERFTAHAAESRAKSTTPPVSDFFPIPPPNAQ